MSNLLAELEEQRRRLTGRSQTSTGSAALSGAQKTGTSEKSGSDGVIELLERQRQSIPANTTVFVRGSESGGQVLGTTAPRTADSTVSAPKKQTRPLEEIRADIDKAQEQLDLFSKTTVPLFEAGWHKERRQAAQDRVDALKSEWKDAAGWDYDAYGDNTPGVTKAINKILDVTGDAALSGVSQFVTGVANTADLALGKPLEAVGWKNNPLRVGADIMNEYNAELTRQMQKSAGDSKAAQTAAQVLASTVAAAPMAVMAFLTGGASAATSASLEATAASQGASAAQMVGQAVSQMMKDPNYWTSFIQEAGNNFREAQEWAGSDEKAAIYALTVGLVNSGIEVGLDGASGIQGLERAVRQGNTAGLRQFLDSAGGEALEEIEQGLVSRGVGQLFGSGAKTFSVTDPDAVINPKTMLEEGAMGGAVGALLTGGTHAVNAAVQRAASNPLIQAYEMGLTRQEATKAPQNAQEAQGSQGVQTVNPVGENAVSPRVGDVAAAESQTEGAGQKNTTPDRLPRISMADFTNNESPVWTNVDYNDTDTRNGIQRSVHDEMVRAGQVVQIPESTKQQVSEAYPDLRGMKKAERTPLLKQKISDLKANLRKFLNGLKGGSYEFEVNGNILEAKLYETGVKEVMEKINRDKASVLYETENIFRNSRYLYSTPDYEGDPNIYRWNYFYTPVQIGDEMVGVRIAVRDIANPQGSQIYNWGIKRGSTLDGDGRGINRSSGGVSSVEPSSDTSLGVGQRGVMPDRSGVSSDDPNNTIPQSASGVNTESGTFNPVIEAYDRAKGVPEGGSGSIPAAHVGSTGIDDAAIQGRGAILSPGAELVNSVVEDALNKAKNRRADVNEILSVLVRHGDNPAVAAQMAEAYRDLTESGAYAVDGAGKLYETGGENDLSINERQDDSVRLGKRNINAFQFDHPEVHRYYAEAAERLLSDFGMTTRGERFFNYVPDQSNPVVTGVKRNTSAPIVAMLDDLNMTYERAQDVLTRIINDQGQENIADAKRVEMLLDDILKHGYESLSGPVEPNADYIETLRRMGQIAPDELTDTGSRRGGGQIRTDADGYAVVDDYDEEGGDIPSTDRNLSAAERGFTTPTRGEMVYTQNKTMDAGPDITPEESERYAPGVHETMTDEMSLERATGRFYQDENGHFVNLEDTVDELLEKESWTGVDQDTAQIAFRWMNAHRESLTEDQYNRFWALHKVIEEIGGTEAGRSLQARQKWVDSGDGIVSKAMSIMDDPRIDRKAARVVIDHVSELAEKYDRAAASGNDVAYFQIIREAALERNTSKLRKNGEIKKTAEWAMKQIKAAGDVEFAKNAARSSIIAMAQDFVPVSRTAKLKAFRRDAMLSKMSTWARNVVSNNAFDPIDSLSRDISVPLDMLLSKFTKTRSVDWDISWVSKAKWSGAKYGAAKSFLEVALDISAEGAESKYGQAGNRTFRMNGGIFERFMSQWEKISNYAMYSTDQMQKGSIQSEVQRGIDRLYQKGKIADDSLRDAGAQEATFRTFQEDSAISKGLSAVRRGLNGVAHVGDIGLGDILMPFVQVPANLVDITIDYSPLGFVRGIYRLTDTLIDAHKGTMTAAQQARAVQTIGRSVNGIGVLALAVLAKMGGALIISDDGSDEDKDKSALESQDGLKGTQLNLSGLRRIFDHRSGEYQAGDTLMSIGFMDPLNALLNMGGLIADDYIAEHEGEKNGLTFGEIVSDVTAGVAQSVMDLPMMSPFAEAAEAHQYSKADTEGGRWLDAAKQFAAGQASSLIPNSIKGLAQGTDTKQRDQYSSGSLLGRTWDSVKAGIPGLRQTLPVKLNSFGTEMDAGDPVLNFLNNNILPGSIVQYSPQSENVEKLMDEIYEATGSVAQYPDKNPPNSIDKDVNGDGKTEKFALSSADKRQYKSTYGGIIEYLVSQVYDRKTLFTKDEALEILTGINSYARAEAKNEFFEENGIDAKSPTNFITKAVAGVQEADIPFVTYLDFWVKKGNLTYEVDEKGNRKVKEAVVKLIDSMNLTDEQKDWLFASESYMNPPAWN